MRTWYEIENKAGRKAKINIHSPIAQPWWPDEDVVGAKKFVQDLDKLDVDEIDLHINSPGGEVFEGLTIYNALRAHKARVNVTVDGLAASIASVVAMAGDRVVMPDTAMMMIHDPYGVVAGNADDMLTMAGALEKIKSAIVAAYRSKSPRDEEEISAMMTAETWITAPEAVELGLADAIFEDPKAAEKAANALHPRFWNSFKAVPQRLKAAATPTPPETGTRERTDDMEFKDLSIDLLLTNRSDLVEQIRAEATAAAAAAERERIRAVRDQLIPGHEDLVEQLMFDGATTGPEAAVKVLAAEKTVRAQFAANLASDGPAPVPPAAPPVVDPPAAGVDPEAPVEERAKAAWDKDAKLRAEFESDFEAYLAYCDSTEKGRVRLLKK